MVSVRYSYAQTAANQFNVLFDGKRVFDNPKPVDDLKELIAYLTSPDDLVLDFFAGSGTTGHAVFLQNTTDSGKRRFLLVQLPEPLDPDNKEQQIAAEFCRDHGKLLNIAEITKERLRRAAKQIKDRGPLFTGDLGFRTFKLASTNIREWDPDRDDLPKTLQESVEHLKTDRTEADILHEILLKLGLDLTVPIEDKTIAGKQVHSVGAGALIVCLAEKIGRKEIEPLAHGIAGWRKELDPAGDTTVVFRDSAFDDDIAKSNITAILEQNGFDRERIRSL
jgi:adenine-specific DNA-methyltransferase